MASIFQNSHSIYQTVFTFSKTGIDVICLARISTSCDFEARSYWVAQAGLSQSRLNCLSLGIAGMCLCAQPDYFNLKFNIRQTGAVWENVVRQLHDLGQMLGTS